MKPIYTLLFQIVIVVAVLLLVVVAFLPQIRQLFQRGAQQEGWGEEGKAAVFGLPAGFFLPDEPAPSKLTKLLQKANTSMFFTEPGNNQILFNAFTISLEKDYTLEDFKDAINEGTQISRYIGVSRTATEKKDALGAPFLEIDFGKEMSFDKVSICLEPYAGYAGPEATLTFDGSIYKRVPTVGRCYDEEFLGIRKFTKVSTAGVKSMKATVYFTADTPQEISYVTDSDLTFGIDCWTDDLGEGLRLAGLDIIVAAKEKNPTFSGRMKVRLGWHYYGNTIYQMIALCSE